MTLGEPDDQGGAGAAGEDEVPAGPTPVGAPASASDVVGEVMERLRSRLFDLGYHALLADPDTEQGLRGQVANVLEDVFGRIESDVPRSMAATGEARLFSVEIGAKRARQRIHPVESLRAAHGLFEVALPIIAARQARHGPAAVLAASLALHEAIMDRIALASLSYVDLLLEQLRASRQEERRRVARELHDRVAHGMALVLQHIEMCDYQQGRDPVRAHTEIALAGGALREAMHTVQLVAAELRRSMGSDGIENALRAYLDDNVPNEVSGRLTITGNVKALPPNVSEELYLIMREAVRNAVRHSRPTEIGLLIAVGDDQVTASVTDNGIGFDQDLTAIGGGLSSMTERTELLRGILELTSEIGVGTRVQVRVPLGAGGI